MVGEVFASRTRGRPYYTGHDLAALLDLARQLGYRIGPAVKAQNQVDPSWWPAAPSTEPPTPPPPTEPPSTEVEPLA